MAKLHEEEARAETGLVAFVEAMQTIRDEKLYPNAGQRPDNGEEPWKAYCRERWGLSSNTVDQRIRVAPIVQRFANRVAGHGISVPVSVAQTIYGLPERVQDAVIDSSIQAPRFRVEARAKSKAVRAAIKKAKASDRRDVYRIDPKTEEPTEDFSPGFISELVTVADSTHHLATKKRKEVRRKKNPLVTKMYDAEVALASYKRYLDNHPLNEDDNAMAWHQYADLELLMQGIKDKLYKPSHRRDWDEEAAPFLGGEEQ